jgi:hypothetical protein
LAVTGPIVDACVPSAGLLFHVIAVSDHVAVTANTVPPTGLASVVNKRSFAAVAGPPRPATVNRRYERYSGVGARTWSVVALPLFLFGADVATEASPTLVKVEVAARAGGAVRSLALHPISTATDKAVATKRIGRNGWGRAARGSCVSKSRCPPPSSRGHRTTRWCALATLSGHSHADQVVA